MSEETPTPTTQDATSGRDPGEERPEIVEFRGVELRRQERSGGRRDHPLARLGSAVREAFAPLPRDRRPPRLPDIEGGRLTALFAHLSSFFIIPVFLLPMVRRDQPFALHHAKAAACTYAIFVTFMLLAIFAHPAFLIPMLLAYIPDLVAIARAARGAPAGKLGMGSLGERVFGFLRADEPSSPPMLEGEGDASHRGVLESDGRED